MNWNKVKLGEIVNLRQGFAINAKTKHYISPCPTKLPLLRIGDMQTGNYSVFVSEDIPERFISKDNDIIYTRTGKVGLAFKNKHGVVHNNCFTVNSINLNEVTQEYLYFALQAPAFRNSAEILATGAAQPDLTHSAFLSLEIDLPPRPVQDKIASILSAYDDMIDNCNKQIALLEEAAQRLYREWFVELHFPGYETTPIGENGLPQGWKEVSLDDVTSKFATGLNPRKNFVLGRGNNFYVTIKNLTETYVVLDDKCDKVDDEAIKKINRRSDLQKGDLLFSGIGTIGRVALISETPQNWNISESLFTLRPNKLVSSEYLYLLLLDDKIQGYAQANSQGSAQKGIRMAALKAYKFPLPPASVLTSFDKIIKPYIDNLNNIHKTLDLYVEARSLLLPRLISGQIEINA